MKMIMKILIANRGEIAVRIIRACREMNIRTVAIYSIADKDSLHVMLADEAVCIGGSRVEESYMNQNAVLQAAINTQAQAIHPGYGFFSENAGFARACEALNIKFIGPSYELIELMGDKQSARDTMRSANIPLVPGSKGIVDTYEEAKEIAKEIGFPILVKATAGGGGKGMRICHAPQDLETAYSQAKLEAQTVFRNGDVYLERFIENPRHIEVQIMGDEFGNVVALFERECSVQRNNQKMIEEAPIQNLSKSIKEKLYETAITATKSIGYFSLGTLEFVMDTNDNFYFIEMNTRVQVEHPVSEMITGIDLIKEQIRIAEGRPLSITQNQLRARGHAIELRINAEDPYQNFMPSVGNVESLHFPGGLGIRIDSFIYGGYKIVPFYDSMIAKIIVHADTRDEAIEKAIRCLEEFDLEGVTTNVEFLLEILLNEKFLDNEYDTTLVKNILKELNYV